MLSNAIARILTGAAPLLLLALLLGMAAPVHAQTGDTTTAAVDIDTSSDFSQHHSPEGALWRAAVLPGWGQYYNRQYLKIPVVYIGLGGITGTALYLNRQYYLYRNAYRYARDPEQFPEYADEAAHFADLIEAGREDLLRRERENMRRLRDLSFIGIGVVYGLTVLDAYVSAHLLTFDIDEDLSLRIDPSPGGVTARFHVRF